MAQSSVSSLENISPLNIVPQVINSVSVACKILGVTLSSGINVATSVTNTVLDKPASIQDAAKVFQVNLQKSFESFTAYVSNKSLITVADLFFSAIIPEASGVEGFYNTTSNSVDIIKQYCPEAGDLVSVFKEYNNRIAKEDDKDFISNFLVALDSDLKNMDNSSSATLIGRVSELLEKVPANRVLGTTLLSINYYQNAFASQTIDELSELESFKVLNTFCDSNEKCSRISEFSEDCVTKGKVFAYTLLLTSYGLHKNLLKQNSALVKLSHNSDALAKNLSKIAGTKLPFEYGVAVYTAGQNVDFKSTLQTAVQQFLKPNTLFGTML